MSEILIQVVKNKVRRIIRNFDKKTQIETDQFVNLIANRCGGLKDKRVLEVGVGQGDLIIRIDKTMKPNEAIGIDPACENKKLSESCKLMQEDIRKTNFTDNYFDIIISSCAFEHIQNFDVAITEMYRILKPNGYLYSSFGPIWSTCYGHHLAIIVDNKYYDYWNFILPPYCHLLMSPNELLKYCIKKTLDENVSKKIVDYVYNSKEQSQLMYEDYERIIKNSKFHIIFFKGYDHPTLSSKYITEDFTNNMNLLKEKYPDYNNFLWDGITLLLKKL